MKVYFSDRFFSTGYTEIVNENNEKIGELDLQSMFTSGIHVLDERGEIAYSGKFRFFSNAWLIFDRYGEEIGVLKSRISFLSKKYWYEGSRGEYEIESPAFSREYTVRKPEGRTVAQFRRTDSFFGAGAFELSNHSELPTEELILVVMGVHAIQKRQNNAAAT